MHTHAFTSPLNAARALRRDVETSEHTLVNRLALLREEEARALARAATLEAKAARAAARHDERAFERMMWAASRETGVHPLRAVGGAMSFPTRAELRAATETLATLAGPDASPIAAPSGGYGRGGAWLNPDGGFGGGGGGARPASPIADALAATAGAAGAALGASSRVPPENPHARAVGLGVCIMVCILWAFHTSV